jgi:hypothetical protein
VQGWQSRLKVRDPTVLLAICSQEPRGRRLPGSVASRATIDPSQKAVDHEACLGVAFPRQSPGAVRLSLRQCRTVSGRICSCRRTRVETAPNEPGREHSE